MKAVGLITSKPVSAPDALVEFDAPVPLPGPHDLLVRVEAVSVNPVDTKVRRAAAADRVLEMPRILGWDAAGIVEAVGPEAEGFRAGDPVYYAGELTRPGSNAEFQLVDARLAARRPAGISPAEAAALPLTAITAWEALFDRLEVRPGRDDGKTLLIIGGAGGVGSIAIQLAKAKTGLKIAATASRPESVAWCRGLGADAVADHRHLVESFRDAGFDSADYILCLNDTDGHWAAMAELVAPQGRICSIVENREPLRLELLKSKSAHFVWEFMFTRSMFRTADRAAQHRLLAETAALVEQGAIRTTLTETLEGLSAASLIEAHRRLESGRMIGKLAVRF